MIIVAVTLFLSYWAAGVAFMRLTQLKVPSRPMGGPTFVVATLIWLPMLLFVLGEWYGEKVTAK